MNGDLWRSNQTCYKKIVGHTYFSTFKYVSRTKYSRDQTKKKPCCTLRVLTPRCGAACVPLRLLSASEAGLRHSPHVPAPRTLATPWLRPGCATQRATHHITYVEQVLVRLYTCNRRPPRCDLMPFANSTIIVVALRLFGYGCSDAGPTRPGSQPLHSSTAHSNAPHRAHDGLHDRLMKLRSGLGYSFQWDIPAPVQGCSHSDPDAVPRSAEAEVNHPPGYGRRTAFVLQRRNGRPVPQGRRSFVN